MAAALILGIFAIFILIYTVCLQCCWSNRRCPWFLDKDEVAKDKYSFCACVQGIQSPDSWQSADLEQVTVQDAAADSTSFTSLAWDDPLALIFVNMNVKVVVCDCGKTYKMSPEVARKFYQKNQRKSLEPKEISVSSEQRYWQRQEEGKTNIIA